MNSLRVVLSTSSMSLAFATSLAVAETGVLSSAVTNFANTEVVSTIPGAIVSVFGTRTTEQTYFNGSTTQTFSISASSNGQARSDFGLNGVFVSGQRNVGLVPQIGSPYFTNATSEASASSQWRDDWQVLGATVGTPVSVEFFGTITGEILAPPDEIIRFLPNGEPVVFDAAYRFFTGAGGQSSITLTAADFIAVASPDGVFSLSWSLVTSISVGLIGQLDSRFFADTRAQNMSCPAVCSETISFSSITTARIDRIVVPDGFSLQVASGQLIETSGGYVYAATLVPEPKTYFLLFLGLVGLVAARRVRAVH